MNTDELPTLRFSAMWSERLGEAIKERAPEIYHMSLVGEDIKACEMAVNRGIDSYLEAVFGNFEDGSNRYCVRLNCEIDRKSLHTLVRRLMELGTDAGYSLASGICITLGIELV